MYLIDGKKVGKYYTFSLELSTLFSFFSGTNVSSFELLSGLPTAGKYWLPKIIGSPALWETVYAIEKSEKTLFLYAQYQSGKSNTEWKTIYNISYYKFLNWTKNFWSVLF